MGVDIARHARRETKVLAARGARWPIIETESQCQNDSVTIAIFNTGFHIFPEFMPSRADPLRRKSSGARVDASR